MENSKLIRMNSQKLYEKKLRSGNCFENVTQIFINWCFFSLKKLQVETGLKGLRLIRGAFFKLLCMQLKLSFNQFMIHHITLIF